MACNLYSIIDEVQRLNDRIRDRAVFADDLFLKVHSVQTRLVSMRQYQEEIVSLHELARKVRNRPRAPLIMCTAAENKQLQQLKIENHALFNSLEEYQTVLDLIMVKYREQASKLLHTKQVESILRPEAQPLKTRTPPLGLTNATATSNTPKTSGDQVLHFTTQVATLATLARDVSDKGSAYANELELELHRLRSENACLRELLEISNNSATSSAGLTPLPTPFANDAKPRSLRGSGVVLGSNQHCDAKVGLPYSQPSAPQPLPAFDIKKNRNEGDNSVYGLLRSFDRIEDKISHSQKDEDPYQYNVDDEDTLTVTDGLVEDDDMLDAEPYMRSFPSLG